MPLAAPTIPRVLGVDDCALRRRSRYATVKCSALALAVEAVQTSFRRISADEPVADFGGHGIESGSSRDVAVIAMPVTREPPGCVRVRLLVTRCGY